jgi:hypothetical protein
MNRREACLTQAAACRARAETDPVNGDRWIDEAIDWLERAAHSPGRVAAAFTDNDAPLLTNDLKTGLAASGFWSPNASKR